MSTYTEELNEIGYMQQVMAIEKYLNKLLISIRNNIY